ncbi:MAG: metallophosphoesterase [Verrucomicrobiaceae bacterium]|nr:MAG: metallophosphoesterase [Verrucomicrobiaceae bacterium]
MTTICIIADTHRRHRELVIPPCDLLIHCGDMCRFQQDDMGTLEDIDCWFEEVPAKRVVCIGGNHDFGLQSRVFRFAHAEYLCDSLIEVEGLKIYGAPWIPDLSRFAFYLPEKALAEKWSRIPAGIDILITHTPPQGILDVPSSGDGHLGCPHLRRELERIQPRLHVFGHIHASHGSRVERGIQFYNAAVAAGRDFHIAHPPFVHKLPGQSF